MKIAQHRLFYGGAAKSVYTPIKFRNPMIRLALFTGRWKCPGSPVHRALLRSRGTSCPGGHGYEIALTDSGRTQLKSAVPRRFPLLTRRLVGPFGTLTMPLRIFAHRCRSR